MLLLTPQSTSVGAWFDDFIEKLRVHQLGLETGTASGETQNLYKTIFNGDSDEIANYGKEISYRHFISKIIVEYLTELDNNLPLKLAFDTNGSEVLVWAVIEDDDEEEKEHNLFLLEAEINAKYHSFGFNLTTMIVENSEMLPIPNHYSIFKS